MMRQIESIPNLISFMDKELRQAAEELVDRIPAKKYQKILLTGCGDSLCAAMAAKFAFMEYAKKEAQVVPVIDLARVYPKEQLAGNGDCLVVAVSNSGRVARMVELAKRVRKTGGCVIAVTGNENSQLYRQADGGVSYTIPSGFGGPGIRSYCGCLTALFYLALSMGTRTSVLTDQEAERIRSELLRLSEEAKGYMTVWERQAKEYALQMKDSTSFEFIGSGIQYASAWFCYAKSLEATGKPSSALNTEDWFHMNYFIRDVYHTATVLFINEGEGSLSRAQELVWTAEDMGRPLLCITDSERIEAKHKILTPKTGTGLLHGLIQYLPVSMLLSETGDLLKEVYFRGGKDNWSACQGCATLINSREQVLD